LNKSIIKSIGASMPTKNELDNKPKSNNDEKFHLVLFFNHNKTWHWLSDVKLREFSDDNDVLFVDKADLYYEVKDRNKVYKAYEKARKFDDCIVNGENFSLIKNFLNI